MKDKLSDVRRKLLGIRPVLEMYTLVGVRAIDDAIEFLDTLEQGGSKHYTVTGKNPDGTNILEPVEQEAVEALKDL